LINNERDRFLLNEMTVLVGNGLMDIARASGSVAHLYQGLMIGN
jgi:hypothetical protein